MIEQIQVKSILNKHRKRDSWFLDDYSVNPYGGCSFGCVYCYIRGSKYGENVAKTLSVKVNAPELLEKQLSRRAGKGEYGIIALSSSTEAYMPVEEEMGMTRRLLEIILKYQFPVSVGTKSKLVLRDLDILREIDARAILPPDLKPGLRHGTIISFSLSTLDRKLAKIFEPGAPPPGERLEALGKCKEQGFLVGVNYIPVLPFLSDSDSQLDEMIGTAKDYGADFVLIGSLTLFGEGKKFYYGVLERHFPELVPKYKSLFRIFPMPSREYQKELEEKTAALCQKHEIRRSIIWQ
ncbi:MAG: radical SAM protein [Chloroflexota bacterium]|nr:radical SAM protein [Chloroflexota bacterium]